MLLVFPQAYELTAGLWKGARAELHDAPAEGLGPQTASAATSHALPLLASLHACSLDW